VYIYRDPDLVSEPAEEEHDAAYWYDLSASEEEPAPVPRETRGPFEPLVSSSGPPPGEALPAADPPAPGPAAAPGDQTGAGEPPEERGEDQSGARARKLEQIKDLYLTAEAIGEENVGKHFDQLLAQQRALITDYFKQPAERAEPAPADEREGEREGEHEGEPSRGAGLASEQPRAW
jgi:hypothetical protein